jgi:hypothetical protein
MARRWAKHLHGYRIWAKQHQNFTVTCQPYQRGISEIFCEPPDSLTK